MKWEDLQTENEKEKRMTFEKQPNPLRLREKELLPLYSLSKHEPKATSCNITRISKDCLHIVLEENLAVKQQQKHEAKTSNTV